MNTIDNTMNQRMDTGRYILFCLAGGLLGWLLQLVVNVQPATVMAWMGYASLNEVAGLPEAQVLSVIYPAAQISAIFFSGLMGCVAAYAISAGLLKQAHPLKDVLIKSLLALPLGLVIGAATGYLAEVIYESAYGAASVAGLVLLIGVGWGIIGIGIALAVSLTARCWSKIIGNMIAGLLAGLIAGIIFGILSVPAAQTGQFIKLIAVLVLVLLIGIGFLLNQKIGDRRVSA
jgi:hypothetical protein